MTAVSDTGTPLILSGRGLSKGGTYLTACAFARKSFKNLKIVSNSLRKSMESEVKITSATEKLQILPKQLQMEIIKKR